MSTGALYTYGSGTLWAKRTDIVNATPIKFGDAMETSLEVSGSTKFLYGTAQFAKAAARGEVKLTGKIKTANIMGRVFADLFFGSTLTAGQVTSQNGEPGTIPPNAPYQLVTANNATYLEDFGVLYSANSLPLVKVDPSIVPTQGQYSVDTTGKYTFSSADAGVPVQLSYTYSVPSIGQTVLVTNQQQGMQPVFSLLLEDKLNGPSGLMKVTTKIFAAVSTKLSSSGKTGDFKTPELDFECMQDDGGNVVEFGFNRGS